MLSCWFEAKKTPPVAIRRQSTFQPPVPAPWLIKKCRKTRGEQGKASFRLLCFPEHVLLRVCTGSVARCLASPALQPSPGSCPAHYQPPAPSFFHRWILALLVQTELRFPFIRTGYSVHSSAGVNQKLLLCPLPGGINDLLVAV